MHPIKAFSFCSSPRPLFKIPGKTPKGVGLYLVCGCMRAVLQYCYLPQLLLAKTRYFYRVVDGKYILILYGENRIFSSKLSSSPQVSLHPLNTKLSQMSIHVSLFLKLAYKICWLQETLFSWVYLPELRTGQQSAHRTKGLVRVVSSGCSVQKNFSASSDFCWKRI